MIAESNLAAAGPDNPGLPTLHEPQPDEQPSAATPGDAPGHRVLLVEDDEKIAALTRKILERAGYEVRVARHGQEGLILAQEFAPELVLLDIMMPGMNGFDVAHALREDPRYAGRFARTPMFFLSAHHLFRTLPGIPDSAWILKPFAPSELLRKVNGAFTSSTSAPSTESAPDNAAASAP